MHQLHLIAPQELVSTDQAKQHSLLRKEDAQFAKLIVMTQKVVIRSMMV